MLKCLPFIGPCGKHIDYIDRRHEKLEQVPDDVIRNFRTLEECRLDANQIKELPKSFFRLKRIRYLTISENELTRLPTAIGSFCNLVELDISRNDISELPTSLRFCDSLQILDVSNNPLQCLPAGFCQLRNLRVLCINDISISELPDEIGSLQSLEKLELRDNCLKSVPNSFGELVLLEFLDLGANEFNELPAVLGKLQNLTELWMDDNELRLIPEDLGNLHKLQQLDLSENLIYSLPVRISGLTKLSDLNLSQNSLTHLPNTFGELKSLCVLKLNQNRLLTLTSSIGKCTNLQEVYLTENFLATLPPSINGLTSVFHLNVDQNQLNHLPEEIGQCTSLNILSLRQNCLSKLPNEIGNCTKLKVLDVSGNRLVRLPLSLSKCSLTALWLSPNQSQPVINLQMDVDPLTNEQYLTCYLLPQEPNETTDATATTNDLTTYSNSIQPGHRYHGEPQEDFEYMNAEWNPAYEPAQFESDDTGKMNRRDDEQNTSTAVTQDQFADEFSNATLDRLNAPRGSRVHFDGLMTTSTAGGSGGDKDEGHLGDFPKTLHPRLMGNKDKTDFDGRKNDDRDELIKQIDSFAKHKPSHVHKFESIQKATDADEGRSSVADEFYDCCDDEDDDDEGEGRELGRLGVRCLDEKVRSCTPPVYDHSLNSDQKQSIPSSNTHLNVQDEEAYSSGGEEIYVLSRRVGFTDDVQDNEEKSNQKLIRRDTPHYTKRARIQSKTTDGVDSEEAVLKILEKYRSSNSPHVSNARQHNGISNNDLSNDYSSTTMKNYSVYCSQEQCNVHVHRQPGAALGLSVAGGIGSIPFRGQDQGIFVSRLNSTGLAALSGLKLGDKLVEVNGTNLLNVEHNVAVQALRTNTDYFHIVVLRDVHRDDSASAAVSSPLVSNLVDHKESHPFNLANYLNNPSQFTHTLANDKMLISCTLHRDQMGFGFEMQNGFGLNNQTNEGLFISKIVDGGSAQFNGRIQVADQIIKINGRDVKHTSQGQAQSILNSCGLSVDLEVLRYANSPHPTWLTTKATESATNQHPHGPTNGYAKTPTELFRKPPPSSQLHNGLSNVRLRTENGLAVDLIRIRIDGGPLGLGICGGSDNNCLPFGVKNEPGIFISKISDEGAAQQTGLRIGDRVLKVNGIDLRYATHDEAVQALIQPTNELQLEVRRDPQPPGLKRIAIFKQPNERLDMHITGGLNPNRTMPTNSFGLELSNLMDSDDDGIFVTSVDPSGAIGRDGRVRLGQRLLEVNGQWMMGLTLDEALKIFREPSTSLNLVVCDGPVEFVAHLMRTNQSRIHSQSACLPLSIIRSTSPQIIDVPVDCPLAGEHDLAKSFSPQPNKMMFVTNDTTATS